MPLRRPSLFCETPARIVSSLLDQTSRETVLKGAATTLRPFQAQGMLERVLLLARRLDLRFERCFGPVGQGLKDNDRMIQRGAWSCCLSAYCLVFMIYARRPYVTKTIVHLNIEIVLDCILPSCILYSQDM